MNKNITAINFIYTILYFILGILIGLLSLYLIHKKVNRLSIFYIIFCGIIDTLLYLKYKQSLNLIMYTILISLMLCISIFDIDRYIIPNIFIAIGVLNKIVFILIQKNIVYNLLHSIINGLLISLPILLLSIILSKFLHTETMGGGDIKLIYMLGTYFNIYQNVTCLLVASIIAFIYMIIRNLKEKRIPFGPFINAAYYLLIMYITINV